MPDLRTPVMTVVEASWQDSSGIWQTLPARMQDKSAGGACIRVKAPIPPGSRVTIEWRFEQFSGIVKYCRSQEREYFVGIQRDAANTPIPARPAPVVLPKGPPADFPAPLATGLRPATPHQSSPAGMNLINHDAESSTIPLASSSSAAPPRREKYEGYRRTGIRIARPANPESAPRREPRMQKAPKRKESGNEPVKERKSMPRKWLDLLKLDPPRSNDVGTGDATRNGGNEKENSMSSLNPGTKNPSDRPEAEGAVSLQVELLPSEEIYVAAGIVNPPKGYGIQKVVEMLNSEHIHNLSKEMKKVAVLMALDAAGVSLDQVRQDAKARQDALDAYEATQKQQAEAEWARMEEEILQIQAELERVKAQYLARVTRNLEGVSRDKTRFSNWAATKQQETQSMSEAVDLFLKPAVVEAAAPKPPVTAAPSDSKPAPEPVNASPPTASLVKAAAAKP
jgi:hypothetical protein